MVHVAATCLLFMLNGLERFCHFSPRGFYSITTTEFMFGIWWPVLLCSFMVYFISWCLLICFFCSFLFIHVHLFSCLFIFLISCQFFSFFFFFFLFLFFLEKNITNLNHLHVDPRLSSAETWLFERPQKMNNDWLVVSTIVYSPFHIWDVILPDG